MRKPNRVRQVELLTELRKLRGSSEVDMVIELLRSMLEDEKNMLVACNSQDFSRVQGKAQLLEELLAKLTREEVSI